MKLVLPSFLLAIAVGYTRGGRLATLGRLRLRWQGLAIVGLGLQMLLWPGGSWPLVYLYVSFVALATFAIVNIRITGVPLNTVYSRIRAARRAFAAELARRESASGRRAR